MQLPLLTRLAGGVVVVVVVVEEAAGVEEEEEEVVIVAGGGEEGVMAMAVRVGARQTAVKERCRRGARSRVANPEIRVAQVKGQLAEVQARKTKMGTWEREISLDEANTGRERVAIAVVVEAEVAAAEVAEEMVVVAGEPEARGGAGEGVTAVAAGREITKHANRMCLRNVEEAGEARRVGARGAAEGRGAAEEMGTSHLGVVVERKVVVGEGRVAAEVKGLGRVGRRSDSLIESRGQFPYQTTNECIQSIHYQTIVYCGNRDCFSRGGGGGGGIIKP